MFNTLIDIDKDGNIFLIDKSIALAPKLWAVYKDKNMGSNMIRWIVSVEDYKSIYRQLPMELREERAMNSLFGEKNGYCTNKKVKEARLEYRNLQYDPLYDQHEAMNEKMFEITKVYRSIKVKEDNIDMINDMSVKMEKAALSRQKIQKMIEESGVTNMQIHGKDGDDLSFQEEMLMQTQKIKKDD